MLISTSVTKINASDFFFLEKEETDVVDDIDFEQLDNIAEAITDHLVSNDINKKFKNSPIGHFFNDDFFSINESNEKSKFYNNSAFYGFSGIIRFHAIDLDFEIKNNPLVEYVKQFNGYLDIEELSFTIHLTFNNSDMAKIETYQLLCDLYRSDATTHYEVTNIMNLFDINQLEQFLTRDNNFPMSCKTLRQKIIFFVFECDNVVQKEKMEMDDIINSYHDTKESIKNIQTVYEMIEI